MYWEQTIFKRHPERALLWAGRTHTPNHASLAPRGSFLRVQKLRALHTCAHGIQSLKIRGTMILLSMITFLSQISDGEDLLPGVVLCASLDTQRHGACLRVYQMLTFQC